jgi:hypothetical protein
MVLEKGSAKTQQLSVLSINPEWLPFAEHGELGVSAASNKKGR